MIVNANLRKLCLHDIILFTTTWQPPLSELAGTARPTFRGKDAQLDEQRCERQCNFGPSNSSAYLLGCVCFLGAPFFDWL